MSLNLSSTNPNMSQQHKRSASSKKSKQSDITLQILAAGLRHKPREKAAAAAPSSQALASDAGAEESDSEVAPKKKKINHSLTSESEEGEEQEEGLTAAATSTSRLSIDARHLANELKELKEIGRHFGKIANRFAFEDNAAAYQVWAIQFKAELLNNDLDSILTSDPTTIDSDELMVDATLYAQQQKTVYHMIFQCVPKVKLSVVVTLPPEQHTGFGAWQALRQFYIGDEQAYLTALESKFQRACWEGSESFPTFETRFDSLLSELETAGAPKPEHVKKATLMTAIEDSPHKDAQNNPVFVRLNTVSKIHLEKPYRDWLMAIRVEAQQIQDSLHKKGTKRSRDHDERKETAMEVSFVTSSRPIGPGGDRKRHVSFVGGPQRGGSEHKPLCHNMQYTGKCTFGTRCKFSHSIPPSLLGRANREQTTGSSSGPRSSLDRPRGGPCWDFQKGKCNRGASCRFAHIAGDVPGSGLAPRELQQAQQFEIMQMGESSNRA